MFCYSNGFLCLALRINKKKILKGLLGNTYFGGYLSRKAKRNTGEGPPTVLYREVIGLPSCFCLTGRYKPGYAAVYSTTQYNRRGMQNRAVSSHIISYQGPHGSSTYMYDLFRDEGIFEENAFQSLYSIPSISQSGVTLNIFEKSLVVKYNKY